MAGAVSSLPSYSGNSPIANRRVPDLLRHLQARPPNPSPALPISQKANLYFQFSTFFRRNAVFLTSIFAGAFAFEMCVPLPNYTSALPRHEY